MDYKTLLSFFLASSAFFTWDLRAQNADSRTQNKPPKLEISGQTNVTMFSFKSRQNGQEGGKGGGSHLSVNDSRLNFSVTGVAGAYGPLEYTAFIGLSGATQSGRTTAEENWIRLRGPWGRFIGGCHSGVDDRMATGPFRLFGATGGVDGNYKDAINVSTGVHATTDLIGAPKAANKITYVTPRVQGVQLGVSFTPHTQQKGEDKLKSHTTRDGVKPFDRNNFGFGCNYMTKLPKGIDLQLAATMTTGHTMPLRPAEAVIATGDPATEPLARMAETTMSGQRHKTFSYSLGALLKYAGFSFGLEYMNHGKSQVLKALHGARSGHSFNVGGAYTFGLNKVSLGYLHTRRSLGRTFNHFGVQDTVSPTNHHAQARVVGLTYDRNIVQGLSFFAEAIHFDYKTDASWVTAQSAMKGVHSKFSAMGSGIGSNNGQGVMLGTKVRF